tara:strand:- start:9262 stop:9936 length:675 start_codon:yes stop_codon:yes gene_type:complete
MSTFLEVVNDVQIRLRETETAAVNTSDLSKLIGTFVNDTKREIEDSFDWLDLRSLVTVTTVSGTTGYDLTGSNRRSRIRTDSSDRDMVWNTTQKYRMQRVSMDYIHNEQLVTTINSGEAIYFALSGLNSGVRTIELSPKPNTADLLRFNMIIPQANLVAGTDEAVEITIDDNALKLGTWAKCIHERGEDGGNLYNEVNAQYKLALNDAISYDKARNEEINWTVI